GTVEAIFAVTVEPVSEAIAEVDATASGAVGAPPPEAPLPPPAELSPALKALYAGPLWRSAQTGRSVHELAAESQAGGGPSLVESILAIYGEPEKKGRRPARDGSHDLGS